MITPGKNRPAVFSVDRSSAKLYDPGISLLVETIGWANFGGGCHEQVGKRFLGSGCAASRRRSSCRVGSRGGGLRHGVGQYLVSLGAWKDIARLLSLSGRELQIVQGVFDDAKDQCIAERMGISQHTVHAHFERLYRKLAVHGRAGLMLRVFATYLTVSGDGHPGA